MKKTRRPSHKNARSNRLDFNRLENRNMLANDVLPDIFAWEDASRGYLHDYTVEGDLLRFSTAFANQGAGHLEVFGGDVLPNGNQEVLQRIYDDEGGFRDRVAGEFTYHPSHGHIHFDGYAIYNLREIGPGGAVGDIVATGGKISFCLIDITRYDPNAGSSNYGSCGTTQGVSAGWSDVYSLNLADQWINISGVDDGDYYLEVVTDPEDQLLESDETNNTTIITVTIQDGPGVQGDRFEANNSFATAYNMGMFSERVEAGLSIHTDQDVDYFQFNAVEAGDFEIHVNFSHALGNIDAFVYDDAFNVVATGDSLTDLEDLHFDVLPNTAYYLQIVGVGTDTNGYDLEFYGPGEVISSTAFSTNVPVSIADGAGSNSPGVTATSTLEGADITLTDLNLIIEDLRHTYLADLHIDITSPTGTTATILRSDFEPLSGPLGSEDNFINTIVDDQSPTNITSGNAPYSGSFNFNFGDIANPLSVFNGENALGTWTISITDWFAQDTGTLNSWGLTFTGIDNNPGDLLEQNDAFPQATDLGTIGTASFVDMSIHNQSDVDFYRFNAQDSTHVQIDLGFVHADGNLDFVVYDSNQQEVARADTINDNESLLVAVEQDELYFIEVYGVSGATNDYSFAIDVPRMVARSGEIGMVDENWQTVVLPSHFDSPVVIVSAPTRNGVAAVSVEIDNVTSNSFDVRLQTLTIATQLVAENLNYFVVEAGSHTLRDGTRIVAGHQTTSDAAWSDVNFGESFGSTPVVFSQLEESSNSPFTSRLKDVDQNGFSVTVQSPEKAKPAESPFDMHWLALEPGTGTSDNGIFEVGTTGERITSGRNALGFTSGFSGTPNLILSAQTVNEFDPIVPRIFALNSQSAGIILQEDQLFDRETSHLAEDVGYLAFLSDNDYFAMEPQAAVVSGKADRLVLVSKGFRPAVAGIGVGNSGNLATNGFKGLSKLESIHPIVPRDVVFEKSSEYFNGNDRLKIQRAFVNDDKASYLSLVGVDSLISNRDAVIRSGLVKSDGLTPRKTQNLADDVFAEFEATLDAR